MVQRGRARWVNRSRAADVHVCVPLDEQRLATLYDEHASAVLGFILRYTRDHAHAEDVLQETMLRAWRQGDALRTQPRPWLFTVARNVLTDEWRRGRARPSPVGADLTDLPEARLTDDADAIGTQLERVLIGEALARLSTDHRVVVMALHYEGRTVADTARLLGVPEGTVKSRCYYALRALRAAFEEMGVLR